MYMDRTENFHLNPTKVLFYKSLLLKEWNKTKIYKSGLEFKLRVWQGLRNYGFKTNKILGQKIEVKL